MKKFKMSGLLMAAVVTVFLTGCINVKDEFVIRSNGNVDQTTDVTVDKQEYLDEMQKLYENAGYKIGAKEMKIISDEFDESMQDESELSKRVIDGKVYYVGSEKNSRKLKELSKYFSDEEIVPYFDKETVYLKEKKGYSSPITTEIGEINLKGVYNMTIEFPKEVVSTNGEIDATNKKRVTFTFYLGKKAEFFATTNKKMTKKKIIAKIAKLNQVGKVSIKKVTPVVKGNKATAKVEFKKAKSATKYKVECSTSKSFKKTVESKTSGKTKVTLSGLKKGKTYYVRVCGMKENYAGVLVSGKWTVKKFTTK
ncbi:MAG: fibronectin type III domain-containing protein [Lachnospiraceae bacterium]|nr:fibronectin type III domain-containing protein [Lachnospiraceae bacterium]